MNIIEELEDMRQRMLQEINTEFDLLIERAREELAETEIPAPAAKPYGMKYPLTAGGAIFKGKKPEFLMFGDRDLIQIKTWKELVEQILKRCIADERYRQPLRELAGGLSGKKRILLAKTPTDMRSPLEIDRNLYMETHYDTETLLNILMTRILIPIGYDYSRITVIIRKK